MCRKGASPGVITGLEQPHLDDNLANRRGQLRRFLCRTFSSVVTSLLKMNLRVVVLIATSIIPAHEQETGTVRINIYARRI